MNKEELMKIKDLVPKNKFDNSNIETIRGLSDEELSVIIPDLLEWLEDYNWPVAQELEPILIERQNLVLPYISDILRGDNYTWRYQIINLLLPGFTVENRLLFKEDLEYLVSRRTNDSYEITISDEAKECLEKYYNSD